MATTLLIQQIESLPASIQGQLADYIAFLVEKYGNQPHFEGEQEPDWATIESEITAFEKKPSLAISEESVNQSLRMRHAN
jgi:hypothetical protein